MKVIELGRHKIEVCVVNGFRMVKHKDTVELLDLKESNEDNIFVDASLITDTLFEKIFITKNATKEQEIIYQGLCIVGIYSLIDEVCEVNLKNVTYMEEFKKYLNPFSLRKFIKANKN